jgi:ribosomal protein S18 acetylase RimI-like enzyme
MGNHAANPSEIIAEEIKIEAAPKSDTAKIAAVFLSAFRDDPLMRYLFSSARDIQKAMEVNFRYVIERSRVNGIIFRTSAAYEGAAIWYLTGFPKSTFSLNIHIAWFMLNQFKVPALRKLISFYLKVEKAHARIISRPHYYLELLGIDAQFQGMGFASKLVKPVLAYADRSRRYCYLETQTEKNVALYQHYGFEVVDTIQPGFGGDAYYFMLRKVKKKSMWMGEHVVDPC